MLDFSQMFVISQNTEILIESNFWLAMYVSYTLKRMLIINKVRTI